MVEKQTNRERKKTHKDLVGRNETCVKAGNPTPHRPNPETLSAMEEGRRIATDNDAPAYTTIEELKTVLEK